jgi:hypothetical protein
MLKTLSLFALLLLMGYSLTSANTYKCQRPDNSVFFTDDPSLGPDECPMERVTDLPLIGIMQEPSQRYDSVPKSDNAVTSEKKDDNVKSFETLKSEATALFAQFRSAHTTIHKSRKRYKKWKARQKLIEIEAQKQNLLSAIDRSALRQSDKEELQEVLSSMTE